MNTIEANRIIADLQERLRLKDELLDLVLESKTLEEAKVAVNRLMEAESAVDMVQRFITPRLPMWIGVELPTFGGFIRVCIGLNMEDGNEVSFFNSEDLRLHNEDSKNCPSPWVYEGDVVVGYGEDAIVFDEEHSLIKNEQ